MLRRDIEPAEKWFQECIRHAVVSGACRDWARREPEAARGLLRAADHHHEIAVSLVGMNLVDAQAFGADLRVLRRLGEGDAGDGEMG